MLKADIYCLAKINIWLKVNIIYFLNIRNNYNIIIFKIFYKKLIITLKKILIKINI